MSEEEKKAIDKLKAGEKIGIYELIRTFKREGIENFVITRKKYVDTVLNLIDNQQKEIEEYKKLLDDRLWNEHISKETDNKWKDKIKAKIEELDIEIQCCEYADDDTEEYKQDIKKEKRRLLRDKAVLQSLLLEE